MAQGRKVLRVSEKDEKHFQKIIFLGDQGVGKTSILNCYKNEHFSSDQHYVMPTHHDGKQVKLSLVGIAGKEIPIQFWDRNGLHEDQGIESYFEDAKAIVIVADLSKPDSYDSIHYWHDLAKRYCPNSLIVLLGNKKDLLEENDLANNKTQFEEKAKELDIKHAFTTSITERKKTVVPVFKMIFNAMAKNYEPVELNLKEAPVNKSEINSSIAPSFFETHQKKFIFGGAFLLVAAIVVPLSIVFWPTIVGLSFFAAAGAYFAASLGLSTTLATTLFASLTIGITGLAAAIGLSASIVKLKKCKADSPVSEIDDYKKIILSDSSKNYFKILNIFDCCLSKKKMAAQGHSSQSVSQAKRSADVKNASEQPASNDHAHSILHLRRGF